MEGGLIRCACSVASDSVTPWTAAPPAPLYMGLSQQKYWSGLPFPRLGDVPDLGIKLSSALAGGFFTSGPPGNLISKIICAY